MLIGKRQKLDIDMYRVGSSRLLQDTSDLWDIFANNDVEEALKDLSVPDNAKELIHSMEVGLGRKLNPNYYSNDVEAYDGKSDNTVVVCFSGGKDSLAAAIKYRELGYNVILYKLQGINKSFPDELKAAQTTADKLGMKLVVENMRLVGKKFWVEHPLKNQVIASTAISYCVENGINPTVVFGDFVTDNYSKSHYDRDWSDCWEVWEAYNKFIKRYISNANVVIAFDSIDDTYEIMCNHSDLIPYYQSCLMRAQYRSNLGKNNKKKFNVDDMLDNRCGSCWKCAMEYIFFADNNVLHYNREYYKHCLDILKDNFSGAKSELPEPKNNTEIHDAYFVNKKYIDTSLYYKDTGLV